MFVFWRHRLDALKAQIRAQGRPVAQDIIKVDSFLNHRLETALIFQMGEELAKSFAHLQPDIVLTVEASGIALALATAHALQGIPVVFAKKDSALNQSPDMAQEEAFSFTHRKSYVMRVDLRFIPRGSRVLIVDDFLADGAAVRGMISLINQAGASLVGVGIGIEKGFQQGGRQLRDKGILLRSLAVIERIEDGHILFADH